MEITIEKIQKRFDELPEDLKWAIMGVKIDEKLMEIKEIYNLNVGQIGQLSLETHAVMMGFIDPNQFRDSIKNSLKLDEEQAIMIEESVDNKIIKEVKNKLISLYKDVPKENKEEDKQEIKTENIEKEIKFKKDEENTNINNKNFINSGAYQKLINTKSSPLKQTDYSIGNISKGNNTEHKTDPYRMPIE